MNFRSDRENIGEKLPLNIDISLPVKVMRDMGYRITEMISDISYASAIIIIAASRILSDWDEWYIPVIILFFLWAITKSTLRIRRG